jgi:channel protein (hemolysin III family)
MTIYLYIDSKKKIVSTIETSIYLIMGWMGIFIWEDLKLKIGENGVRLLGYSGLSYTVGVIFFILGKTKPVIIYKYLKHIIIIILFCRLDM